MSVLMYLIELKVSLELPSFGGLTPLHHACKKNQEKLVSKLIAAGANINAIDDNGDTPLQFASSRGVLNIVVELLDNGATQNPNGQGVTPIHKAALFGQLAVVKRLFEIFL
jgi:26S proteasome non-ATPase regulatory subunit 10